MSFGKHTLKDIAKALNLSTSTVSRALRDSYEIGEKTKKRVLDYAAEINFQVNPIARSLKEKRSNTIGIIVNEISNNFLSQVIEGVESVAFEMNYQVLISQSLDSAKREKKIVEHFFSRSVDGLLMTLTAEESQTEYLQRLAGSGYPLVFFDRVPGNIAAHKVIAENVKGSFKAVEYLLQAGCRRIAHLTGNLNLSTNRERLDGFKEGLLSYGLEFDERFLAHCDSGVIDDQQMQQVVSRLRSHGYDGIFISGDRLTTGYLQAINKMGYAGSGENQAKIVGFTNSKVVDIFSPSIVSIKQPAIEMGQQAARLLISQIQAKYPLEDFQTLRLPLEVLS